MRSLGRKLLLLAGLAYVAAVLLWLAQESSLRHGAYPAFSVQDQSPEGLSLAYEYLQGKGKRVVKTLGLPVRRATLPAHATLFRIAPLQTPLFWANKSNPREGFEPEDVRKAPALNSEATRLQSLLLPEEEQWVRAGGRLVLAVKSDYAELQVTGAALSAGVEKVLPLWPDVQEIQASHLGLAGPVLNRAEVWLASGPAVLGARLMVGQGDVVLLSCPEIFQNRSLGEGDHLRLLEQLAGAGRPAYFDEFLHGLREEQGALALLRFWGFGPLLLLGGVALLAVYWRLRVRLGAEEEEYRETRNVTVDLVDSLAPLYQRALKRHQALALYYQFFVQAVGHHTGLRGEALKQRARELSGSLDFSAPLPRRKDYSPNEFNQCLRQMNEAFRRLEHGQRR